MITFIHQTNHQLKQDLHLFMIFLFCLKKWVTGLTEEENIMYFHSSLNGQCRRNGACYFHAFMGVLP